jgi:hypothetical protein
MAARLPARLPACPALDLGREATLKLAVKEMVETKGMAQLAYTNALNSKLKY